jgi:hypothetical protein
MVTARIVLSEIAHFKGAVDLDFLLVTLRLEFGQAFALQLVHDPVCAFGVETCGYKLRRALPVDPRIGHNESISGELCGMNWHDGARNSHLADQGARMQRCRATEGAEGKIPGIETTLDENGAQRADHIGIDNAAARRLSTCIEQRKLSHVGRHMPC